MRTLSKYIVVFAALLATLLAAPAFAGDTTVTGYRNFKYGKEIENRVWEDSGEALYRSSDGVWKRVDPDGAERPADPPEEEASESWIQKWRPKVHQTLSEGSAPVDVRVGGIGGERNGADWLGAAGKGSHRVVLGEQGFEANGELEGRVYLGQVRFDVEGELGDEDAKIHARLDGEAFVGAEGSLNGEVTITSSKTVASAGIGGFAGAKGVGRLPITATLCAMSVMADMAGEVSYGIGGKASGLLSVDWSNLTAKISGELAATLGLGMGAGGTVKVNLGALLKDSKGTIDCLNEKLAALGRQALSTGGFLLDSAGSAVQSGLSGVAGLLGLGAERSEADPTEGAAEVVTSIVEAASGAQETCP